MRVPNWLLLFYSALLLTCSEAIGRIIDELKQLRQDVFDKYVSAVPFCQPDEPIMVNISWNLYTLMRVDDIVETIDVSGWYTISWYDCTLTWDSSQYNLTFSEFPAMRNLWTPDLTWRQRIPLVDAFETSIGLYSGARTFVHSNGAVSVSRELLMRSYCPMSMWYFPFDLQLCNISFLAWSYPIDWVLLQDTPAPGSKLDMIPSDSWSIVDIPVYLENSSGALPGATYSTLTYQLVMARQPIFYIFYLMLPFFVISLLNCFVFLIPAEVQEKITFSLSILLSLSMYMMLISSITPPKAEIPLLSVYFFTVFVLSIVSATMTVLIEIANAHHSLNTPPRWLANIFIHKGLGKYSFFRRIEPPPSQTEIMKSSTLHSWAVCSDTPHGGEIHLSGDNYNKSPAPQDHISEWRQIAYAVDKLMFIIYFAISVLVFLALILAGIALQNAMEYSS